MSKPKPFNNPFGAIKLQQEAPKPAPGKGGPARPAPPPKAQAPLSKSKAASLEEDEAFLFLSSVGEVETVTKGKKLADPPPPKIDPRRLVNEDTEVLTQLSELVAGTGTFEVSDSTEFLEGAIANLDPRVLQKLRRGEYPLQGRLDLHGLTRRRGEDRARGVPRRRPPRPQALPARRPWARAEQPGGDPGAEGLGPGVAHPRPARAVGACVQLGPSP